MLGIVRVRRTSVSCRKVSIVSYMQVLKDGKSSQCTNCRVADASKSLTRPVFPADGLRLSLSWTQERENRACADGVRKIWSDALPP